MRVPALAAVLLSLAASPAWCDGPVATAPSAAVTPVIPSADPPGPLGPDSYDDADAAALRGGNACDRNPIARGPYDAADNGVHGQVDVGVGTNGYRHVGIYACKPVDGGSVAVSVSHSEGGWGRRR